MASKGHEVEFYIIRKSIMTKKFVIDPHISFHQFDFKYFSVADINSAFFQSTSGKPLVFIPITSNHPVNDLYVYQPPSGTERPKL
ncbi:hypothetical protein O9G_000791 [Rozella allomycis CSF55]|uniref:Uncharacterized protein n=1 Tax=Rozella allomycis (strain CSF55) TaxID=988480 RepID=A0A075AR00_ROZAC|nr:hypothetical protein O9G_000791 [Rozella allomycis CSF55]|eukprot:EPZ32716.1 hypothetical protein O9G_000791 [Rozella allomycis CSF55]